MIFTNVQMQELWNSAKGNKKEFAKMLRARERKANAKQKSERMSNLKRMLAKGLITQEYYNEKIDSN